jgi:hypothetical protein
MHGRRRRVNSFLPFTKSRDISSPLNSSGPAWIISGVLIIANKGFSRAFSYQDELFGSSPG